MQLSVALLSTAAACVHFGVAGEGHRWSITEHGTGELIRRLRVTLSLPTTPMGCGDPSPWSGMLGPGLKAAEPPWPTIWQSLTDRPADSGAVEISGTQFTDFTVDSCPLRLVNSLAQNLLQ